MKLLIDSNVVLDVLLQRQPFYEVGSKVLFLTKESDGIENYVSAASITDIHYIAYRNLKDHEAVMNLLERLLSVVKIATVTSEHINNAVNLYWRDFEDSVQYSVAKGNNMDGIVTRNMRGFADSDVKIFTPEELLDFIKSREEKL